MLTECGHYLMIASLLFTSFLINQSSLIPKKIMEFLLKIYFILLSYSMATLAFGYLISDFSIVNVAHTSHIDHPLIYKIGGLWANHEGSMLLWTCFLAIYLLVFLLYVSNLPYSEVCTVIRVHSSINLFFLAFVILTSNPFLHTTFFQPNGNELNPALLDPGLIIHPPFLYAGYLGYSLAFSLALTLLLNNTKKMILLKLLYKTSLGSWICLTFGITLGSWWAYHELGWGGWWFWDPVENVSLMPWLVGTALLHIISLAIKKHSTMKYVIFLTILAFLLVIIGTFFVRSGLLTSVHSFAVDPHRGGFILVFLFYLVTLSLFGFYHEKFYKKKFLWTFLTKETFIFGNYFLFLTFCILIFIGTFSPILSRIFANYEMIIGSSYYTRIIVPIILPLLLMMIFGSNLVTRAVNVNYKIFYEISLFCFGASLPIIITFFLHTVSDVSITPLILIFLAYLVLLTSIFLVLKKGKLLGVGISHLGFALLILAITISTFWEKEIMQILLPGDSVTLSNYTYTLRNIQEISEYYYRYFCGNVFIINDKITSIILFPERVFSYAQGTYATKAAIQSGLLFNIHFILGDGNIHSGWYTHFIYSPLLPEIWIGAFIIVIGAIISILQFRLTKKNYWTQTY